MDSETGNAIQALHEVLSRDLTSLEIIPGDWGDWASSLAVNAPSESFPFLLVEENLGIPEKVIYRSYLASSTSCRRGQLSRLGDKGADAVLQNTSCTIIANPAHQTALNARKRLISNGLHSAAEELRFVELLLRGVKACAKESALWAHRQWCLTIADGNISDHIEIRESLGTPLLFPPVCPTLLETVSRPFFSGPSARKEFSIVKQAFTIYPRNYHAWTHWRYTFDTCSAILMYAADGGTVREEISRVILEEFRGLRGWIDSHTTDSSAVHHLLASLPAIRRLISFGLVGAAVRQSLEEESSPSELAKQAWANLSSWLPTREASWIYLTSLLPLLTPQERALYVEDMGRLDIPWEMHRKHFISAYS